MNADLPRIIFAKISLSERLLKYATKVGGFENLSTMIDVHDKRVPYEVEQDFIKLRKEIFEIHFEALDSAMSEFPM